jgi:predicted Zn-dependent peptidase
VSALFESYADSGVLEIVAESAHASAHKVLAEMLKVLIDLSEHGPSPAEMERVKARLRWQMVELYDMPTELAAFVGQGVLSSTAATPEQRVAELLQIDAARVRDAAARIFRAQQSSLVVVGKLDRTLRAKLQQLQRRLAV